LHRFPGAFLVKAFNLAIKGLHYQTAMHGIVRHAGAQIDADAAVERERSMVADRAPSPRPSDTDRVRTIEEQRQVAVEPRATHAGTPTPPPPG
jgi:hypothetical protein